MQFEDKYGSANERKDKRSLRLAAGFAVATVLTSNVGAQTDVKHPLTITETRNSEGKTQKNIQDIKPDIKNKKKIFIRGYVAKSYRSVGKIHSFTIGYYDNSKFVVVKKFSSNAFGKFKIRVTEQELQLLQNNKYKVACGKHPVSHNNFNFLNLDENLILTVKRRIQWMGKF